MNRFIFYCLLIFIMGFYSCKSNNSPAAIASTVDTVKFLPINDFILSDIKDVKNIPYFIYKIRTVNKKKDSTTFPTADFEKFAAPFLQYDINKQPLKGQFKETTFHDNTTKSNTFIYTPINADIAVRNITVLLDEATDKPKNIFIQINKQLNDTTVIERLQWKPRKSFRITKISQAKNFNEEETNYVSWNDVIN